ncbi:hypothetical protein MKW94_014803 [Papaver nudicaule]|uniref:Plant heme peroxidase family profile domain-containing protein n=1 Tax=Papaver nudicaule TaxID=74823 RepID=A0AA41UZ43_PAPNU|nr:hypothetical protein [Papaver nudicaule]
MTIAPALIRLVFHDCFIVGCDGFLLLNGTNGVEGRRDQIPTWSLKGFDVVEEIKSTLEFLCPGIVSYSDVLVLAVRDRRRDSLVSFPQISLEDIKSPTDDLQTILQKFSGRNLSPRETVSLLGAHNTGAIHGDFIQDRLQHFLGTGQPDFKIGADFLNMGAPQKGFGTRYFQGLVQNMSVLHFDLEAYAAHNLLFTHDFSREMAKLSDHGILTGPIRGQIRDTCSIVKTDL